MDLVAELRLRTRTWIGIGVAALAAAAAVSMPAQAQTGEAERQTAPAEDDRVVVAIAEGERLLAQGQYASAAEAFRRALNLQPANEAAQRGLEQALTMLNQAPTISGVEREIEIQRQEALAEFQSAMQEAGQHLDEGRYDRAQEAALTARIRLAGAQNVLRPNEYDQLDQRAAALLDRIEQERMAAQLMRREQQAAEAERQQVEARTREELARQEAINENLRRVRQLQAEMKYDEALQVIDEILAIDPLNPSALALRDVLLNVQMFFDLAEIERRKSLGIAALSVENQAAMIPPKPNLSGPGDRSTTGIMQYPEDWKSISLRRGHETGFQETAADRRVLQTLASTQIPVDFTNNTFEQVVAFLEQVTGLSIYVDWKALELEGINRDDEITLNLREVPVETALERVLEQVGDDLSRPKYAVQDGILTISTDEQLRRRVLTVVYDIGDLLFEVPMFDNAPDLDLDSALNQGQGGGGSGGGGGGFGGGGGGGGGGRGGGGSLFGEPGEEPERRTREELIDEVISLIQDSVDPEGWRDLGGETGIIREFNGNLIITNTPQNHRAIEGLLSQLREIRALQINVESRFLAVQTDWFEKIGVDLDLYFNTDDDLVDRARQVDPNFQLGDFFNEDGTLKDPLIFGNFDQIPAGDDDAPGTPFNTVPTGALFGVPVDTDNDGIPDSITYGIGPTGAPIRNTDGFSPIGVVQDHNNLLGSLAEFDVGSFAGLANGNPALALGVQFLDDIQVDLLIEATQADRRSVVLTAPRLTFFNGQRAWVAVATQTAFISGLQAATGDAAGAFTPDIGTLNEGFVLDVEGVISADRRYVTMTVLARLAELIEFRESDATEFGGAAGGGGITGGRAGEFTGQVELPVLQVSVVQTTVSVPDKGTILLGGQREVREIEVEAGVPVLSKIPFINRFFTNRVTSKDENSLLILIRPEIIIQQENEEILFPGLGDALGSGAYLQ